MFSMVLESVFNSGNVLHVMTGSPLAVQVTPNLALLISLNASLSRLFCLSAKGNQMGFNNEKDNKGNKHQEIHLRVTTIIS